MERNVIWRGDGWHHERVASRLLLAACPLLVVAVPWLGWLLPLLFLAGMWCGIYLITPDVDFLSVTQAETRWFRDPRGGDPVSWLTSTLRFHVGIAVLVFGFWPGLLLSHRGVSHVPAIGAAVIAALAMVNPFVLGLLTLINGWRWLWTLEALAVWLGFAVAHLIHIVCDWIW